MEKSKLSKTDYTTNYFNGVAIEEKYITNLESSKELEIKVFGKIYRIVTQYNEDRGKWLALCKFDGKTQSLSFFQMSKDAIKNSKLFIMYLNGAGSGMFGIEKSVGD